MKPFTRILVGLASLSLCSTSTLGCGTRSDAAPSGSAPSAHADGTAVAPSPSPPAARPALHAVPVEGLPVMGPKDALVTVVEFTDYDCPFCRRAEGTIADLRAKYGADLRVVVAEDPLPMHPRAHDAALAALAAAHGGHFDAMHAALFAHPEAHTDADLSELGRTLAPGSDFDRVRASDEVRGELARAGSLASTVGVRGTPTFFINGRRIVGAQPFATFDDVTGEELAHARDLVAHGVARADVYARILDEAREHPAETEGPDRPPPSSFVEAARDLDGPTLLGDAQSPRKIVLFTDFECPYCAKLDARLRDLVRAHPDVHVVLHHSPLPMHLHARLAAKAVVAAEAQGKLVEYAALLFPRQMRLDRDALVAYAVEAGLDRARFVRDLDAEETERRVADDEALAKRLDVRGTPTSFVDGLRVTGAQSTATFEDALAGKRAE